MKSNWEATKAKSSYHFDPKKRDQVNEAVRYHGKFSGNWQAEVEQVIASAKPTSWATRGYKTKDDVSPDIESEEYDLVNAGAAADLTVCSMEWEIPQVFKNMADAIGLEDSFSRIHIMRTGDVFNLHIDKLEKWNPEDPSKVMRFMIYLNDWQMGMFSQFGTFNHSHWSAGEIYSFDWANVPHCAANAGYHPRALMLVTGIVTEKTKLFLSRPAHSV
jgi:hypothetical protein